MKAYSLDLRRRVVAFVEASHSCHAAAAHFDVSVSFVVKLIAAFRATGSYAPKPEGGWRYSSSIRNAAFWTGVWRRSPISRWRNSPANWRRWGYE